MTDAVSPEAFRALYVDRLIAERRDIITAGQSTGDDRRPVVLDQQSVGRLSRMDALQGQAMANALQSRRDGRIKAIDAALERLQGEDFGWCEDCGDLIGSKRLDLDPTLQRCVSCAR